VASSPCPGPRPSAAQVQAADPDAAVGLGRVADGAMALVVGRAIIRDRRDPGRDQAPATARATGTGAGTDPAPGGAPPIPPTIITIPIGIPPTAMTTATAMARV